MHRRAEGRGEDHFIQNRWPFVLRPKWQAAVCSVLLPTHTCTHTLSPKIPSLTWLSVRLFRLFKMLSHFLSIQQIAELYWTDGLNCDAVVPWHKVEYLFTVTREVKAVCKREVTASVWTQCNINPTKSELSFRFYLLFFYIIFMFFFKERKNLYWKWNNQATQSPK